MKLSSLCLYRYSLPLVKPIVVKDRELATRDGFLLELYDEHDNIAYGEIAPLPGVSCESLNDCHEQLLRFDDLFFDLDIPEEIQYLDGKLTAWLESHSLYPSVRFGWEMALLNLLALRNSLSLSRLLNGAAPQGIRVNALIDRNDNLLEAADRCINEGYRNIKVKVGARDIDEEKLRIQSLSEYLHGKGRLRIDINQQWLCADVLKFTEGLDADIVEYLEEPFHDVKNIAYFHNLTHIPVALDESLYHADFKKMLALKGVKTLVIKPTLYGGIEKTAIIARLAELNHTNVVISSCFESFCGIDTLAHLSAALSPKSVAGLDTLNYFEENFITGLPVYQGPSWQLLQHPIGKEHINEKMLELII